MFSYLQSFLSLHESIGHSYSIDVTLTCTYLLSVTDENRSKWLNVGEEAAFLSMSILMRVIVAVQWLYCSCTKMANPSVVINVLHRFVLKLCSHLHEKLSNNGYKVGQTHCKTRSSASDYLKNLSLELKLVPHQVGYHANLSISSCCNDIVSSDKFGTCFKGCDILQNINPCWDTCVKEELHQTLKLIQLKQLFLFI